MEKGERKSLRPIHTSPDEIIRTKRTRHLLYVNAKVGSVNLKLGIDCGAELSIMDKKRIHQISDYYTSSSSVKIVAIADHKIESTFGMIEPIQIGQGLYSLNKVVLADLTKVNRHLVARLDGFLGYDFLSNNKIGINVKKKIITIWSGDKGRHLIYAKKPR